MAHQDDWEEQTTDDLQKQRVVYTLPGMKQATVRKNLTYKTVEETNLQLDVYYPPAFQKHTQLPAVILIHGDGPTDYLKTMKDGGQYVTWGQLIAASGLIAVTANHRSTEGLTNVAGVANDIDDLMTYVLEHGKALHIDTEVLAIWTCSTGAPFGLRTALYETPPYVRCIVSYYGITELKSYLTSYYQDLYDEEYQQALPSFTEEEFDEFSAAYLLQHRPAEVAPIFIARAGLDDAILNESIDIFSTTALAQNVTLTLMNHPNGQHGFDILDDDPRTHEIIKATLEFLKTHLL